MGIRDLVLGYLDLVSLFWVQGAVLAQGDSVDLSTRSILTVMGLVPL